MTRFSYPGQLGSDQAVRLALDTLDGLDGMSDPVVLQRIREAALGDRPADLVRLRADQRECRCRFGDPRVPIWTARQWAAASVWLALEWATAGAEWAASGAAVAAVLAGVAAARELPDGPVGATERVWAERHARG